MKKIAILVCMLAVFACNSNTNQTSQYRKVYENAMAVKDYQTAITALQFLLLDDSTNTAYLDTIPELYAAVRNVEAADHYTGLALKRNPDSEKFLQLKALCAQQLGRIEEEMDIYHKLYAKTQRLTYLYQIATFELESGQVQQGIKTLQLMESKMEHSTDSVDMMVSQNQTQKVPVKAAVYNMKAYITAQNRDLAGAKKYFEMALKEYPDFVMAKQNLMQLMRGGKQ